MSRSEKAAVFLPAAPFMRSVSNDFGGCQETLPFDIRQWTFDTGHLLKSGRKTVRCYCRG